MCEVKPGRRCASHTSAEAESASTTLEIDQPFSPSLDPVTNGAPRFDPADLPTWDSTSRPAEVSTEADDAAAISDWDSVGTDPADDAPEPQPDPAPEGGHEAGSTGDDTVDEEESDRAREVFEADYDSKEDRYEAYRAELDRATLDLSEKEHWQNYLNTVSRFHKYSFRNQMMIRAQRPNATQCASYKTWQSIGRQVSAGEKGIKIWAPIKYKKAKTDGQGKPLRDENGKTVEEEKLAFRSVNTFDVSQTHGKDYTVRDSELSTTPPPGFQEDLENAVKAEGFTVRYGPMEQGLDMRGYTRPGTKEVYIREDLPPAAQVTTLAHELGHIKAGHMSKHDEYKHHRGRMEVEAESVGYVTCRANGMKPAEVTQQSRSYIKGWRTHAMKNEQATKAEIEATATTVNKAARDLLDSGLFRNVDRSGGKATAPAPTEGRSRA